LGISNPHEHQTSKAHFAPFLLSFSLSAVQQREQALIRGSGRGLSAPFEGFTKMQQSTPSCKVEQANGSCDGQAHALSSDNASTVVYQQ
jgi:hypothetical protein